MKILDNTGKLIAVVLSIFLLFATGYVVLFHHNEKIDFKKISMLKQETDENGSNYIKCQLFSNLGTQNYLMLEMAIPYENQTQYEELNQKIDRIKSDMLTNIDQEDMSKWVKERDFTTIKGELLKVINKHSNKTIENIYFDSFLYQ